MRISHQEPTLPGAQSTGAFFLLLHFRFQLADSRPPSTLHPFEQQKYTAVSLSAVHRCIGLWETAPIYSCRQRHSVVSELQALCVMTASHWASGCGPNTLHFRDGAPLRPLTPAKCPGTRGWLLTSLPQGCSNCPSVLPRNF